MKKLFMAALLLSVSVSIFGQTIEEFNNVVDSAYTFKDLYNQAAQGDMSILPSRFIIIDGAVADRKLVTADRDNYLGELDLVSGEWVNIDQALKYECIVQLIGPDFAGAIPARRTRTPGPKEIQVNSRIMIVAKITGLRQMNDGSTVAVLRAYYVRTLY